MAIWPQNQRSNQTGTTMNSGQGSTLQMDWANTSAPEAQAETAQTGRGEGGYPKGSFEERLYHSTMMERPPGFEPGATTWGNLGTPAYKKWMDVHLSMDKEVRERAAVGNYKSDAEHYKMANQYGPHTFSGGYGFRVDHMKAGQTQGNLGPGGLSAGHKNQRQGQQRSLGASQNAGQREALEGGNNPAKPDAASNLFKSAGY